MKEEGKVMKKAEREMEKNNKNMGGDHEDLIVREEGRLEDRQQNI